MNVGPRGLTSEEFFKLEKQDRAYEHQGWTQYYDMTEDGKIVSRDFYTDEIVADWSRPCSFCGIKATQKAPGKDTMVDACLGILPGVDFACCGHGKSEGYILFENGVRVTLQQKSKQLSVETLTNIKRAKNA